MTADEFLDAANPTADEFLSGPASPVVKPVRTAEQFLDEEPPTADAFLDAKTPTADEFLDGTHDQSYVGDKVRRLARGAVEGAGQVVEGMGTLMEAARGGHTYEQKVDDLTTQMADWLKAKLQGRPLDPVQQRVSQKLQAERRAARTVEDPAARELKAGGQQIRELAPFYQPDETRDTELGSRVAGAAGTMAPIIASGPAAPLTGATMMGQMGADDAKKYGATQGQQDASAAINAAVGMVAEFVAGQPALMRSLEKFAATPGTTLPDVFTRILKQVGLGASRGAVMGAGQTIAGNVAAKEIYDPNRKLMEGVPESALDLAIVSGATGGAFQMAGERDRVAAQTSAKRQFVDSAVNRGYKASDAEAAWERVNSAIEAPADTGKTIPESTATLQEQQKALIEGRQQAQMFPKGTPELAVPDGMARVQTDRGVFHFNPEQITADQIRQASAAGRENEVLGLGPASKADLGNDATVSVVERTPTGTEVKAAMASPETAPATMAEMKARAGAGNTVGLEQPGKTLVERLRAADEAKAAETAASIKAEEQRRAEANQAAAERRGRFDLELARANKLSGDAAAAYADVASSLNTLGYYAEDNSAGLNLDQRRQAAQLKLTLEKKLAALQPAEDARRQAAQLTAEQFLDQTKARVRTERDRMAAIDRTGRDPDTGKIEDITKVPTAELESLNPEAEGITPARIEAELMRRAQEEERAGAMDQGDRNDLLEVLRKVKLPNDDAALGGELKSLIREHMSPDQRRRLVRGEAGSLDTVAEQLRADYGFSWIQTPADVIDAVERALRGEKIYSDRGRGEQTDGAADFARGTAPAAIDPGMADKVLADMRARFPELTREYDLKAGLVQDELRKAGYLGRVPDEVQAAVLRMKAERDLLVIAYQAVTDYTKGVRLFVHELAHPYWDTLPEATQQALRDLHAREIETRTGPLYDETKPFAEREPDTDLQFITDLDENGHKEWFAERVRALNEQWAEGQPPARPGMLARIAYELRRFLARIWAQVHGLANPEEALFTSEFREWMRAGARRSAQPGRAALAYARKTGTAEFASERMALPEGDPNAGIGEPGYIPTVEAMRYAKQSIGNEQFRQLVRERFEQFEQSDPAMQNGQVELIAREAVDAAKNGRDPIEAIREATPRYKARMQELALLSGDLRALKGTQPPARPQPTGRSKQDAYMAMKWKARMKRWAEAQGSLIGPFVDERGRAEIVTRNTRPGEQPWRVTFYDENREVIFHEDYGTREQAAIAAAGRGKFSPDVSFATGKEQPPLERLAAKQIDATPNEADRQKAAQWEKVMPAFQGGKYQMAEPVAALVAKTLSAEQRAKITTVVDYFGGGGLWGAYLSLTHFPNVKRVVVHELDPLRAAKIRLFHEKGEQLAQILEEPTTSQWLDAIVAEANSRGTTSGSAIAALIVKNLTPERAAIAGLLKDAAMSARGRALDQDSAKTAQATMAKLKAIAIRDAADAAKGAQALRERGIKTEVREENSYEAAPTSGDTTLAVMDPPYYNTTGYDGKIVGLGIYERTAAMLQRLAKAGNAIIYTDSAWHRDNPELLNATGDIFQGGVPADQAALGSIVDSLNTFAIVPVGDRHEILGINQPGHTEGAENVAAKIAARDNQQSGGTGRDQPDDGGTLRVAGRPEQVVAENPQADRGMEAEAGTGARETRRPRKERPPEIRQLIDRRIEVENLEYEIDALKESQEDPAEIEAHGQMLTAKLAEARQQLAKAQREEQVAASLIPMQVTKVEPVKLPDRKTALIEQWKRGNQLQREGYNSGNSEAENEGLRLIKQARERLNEEFTGWEDELKAAEGRGTTSTHGASSQPTLSAGGKEPPREPPPTETAAADDQEPSPFRGEDEQPAPDRGRAVQVYGHSAWQPSWLHKSWEKVRRGLQGFKSSLPDLPTFPAAHWNKGDHFLQENGPHFYQRLREGIRQLRNSNDYVQHTAQEQVGSIVEPLLLAGKNEFSADDYARLNRRQEQQRRAEAAGKPMPAGAVAELKALQSKIESSPYVLFNKLVMFLDLDWRARNLKDSSGNPIVLPLGLNATEVKAELTRLGNAVAASPWSSAIEDAVQKHMALVKSVAGDLQARGLMAPDALENPYYFPHLTLTRTEGDKTVERELRIGRVKVDTAADFRGYLIDPVGSRKPIETDYTKALYYHLVQVGAHNMRADVVRDYARPYDIMDKVRQRAQELSRERGTPVSWEQAYHEEYQKNGYVLYGADSGDWFPALTVDRNRLAERLGVQLTTADLHKQLEELGLQGIKLLPEDIRETLDGGSRETWVLPSRVADTLRRIQDEMGGRQNGFDQAARAINGVWKGWKLFMPWNHVRYEYGNVVADLEKIFSGDPAMAKQFPAAAREIAAFFKGEGRPSETLKAAVKLGVINSITAQEMGQLSAMKEFEGLRTTKDKVQHQLAARASTLLLQPITVPLGLGDKTSVQISAMREAIFRYAKFKSDMEKMQAGARPAYGGAYWKDVENILQSRTPDQVRLDTEIERLEQSITQRDRQRFRLRGAPQQQVAEAANRDRTQLSKLRAERMRADASAELERQHRAAAEISLKTFGDYGDMSASGKQLREKLIPFYSWVEVNFKYHANLFRNLRDMVLAGEMGKAEAAMKGAGAAGVRAAGFGARVAGGTLLRLAIPYMAVQLWNSMVNGDLEDTLSAEDKRRFHIIVGKDEQGRTLVIYAPTAFLDVVKYISGPEFSRQMGEWMRGRTDFATAMHAWLAQIAPDLANNTVGQAGPLIKIPYTLVSKKNPFPDVTDQRSVPAYDMKRVILGQMTDDFVADQVMRAADKDYMAPKSMKDWARQLVLQTRLRDPEQWAFYDIKDRASAFYESKTGRTSETEYNAPDQQVLRNFRKSIYRGDVENAMKFYNRLIDLGYTAERFEASVRSQDPLAQLPKAMRKEFVASLDPLTRQQLDRAYAFYTRMAQERGAGKSLFPSEKLPETARARWQPHADRLLQSLQSVDALHDDEIATRAAAALRQSLKR